MIDERTCRNRSSNAIVESNLEAGDKSYGAFRTVLPQILAVSVKNVLLLGYGMTIGFPTIVIPAIQGGEGRDSSTNGDFKLQEEEISWLSSINLICVPLGCLLSGVFTQPIGRRRAMQIVNIPIAVAWLLFYFSTSINHLYAGLCLAGLSGGLLEAPVLTYVAEVTQANIRGTLAATGSLCVIVGIFIQFIMGSFLRWRTIALISTALPCMSFVALLFVPESPYWLIRKNRLNEARSALAWLRGWVPVALIEKEFQEICDTVMVCTNEHDNDTGGKLNGCLAQMSLYKRVSFLAPYGLVTLTFFIGHFSGMTTLQTYAVQIFHTLKAPIDKYYATVLLGSAELLGTLCCVIFVHRTGKRPLVLASTFGCGICFLGTATYAYFLEAIPGQAISNIVAISSFPNSSEILMSFPFNDYEETVEDMSRFRVTNLVPRMETTQTLANETFFGIPQEILLPLPQAAMNSFLWVPLTLLLGSAFLSHLGIRLIPWMLIGEVFPASVRSGASGLSSGTGYMFGFIANKVFLQMIGTLTLPGTFWMYAGISCVGGILLIFFLPETESRTLLEIEEHFTGIRKLSDKINKPENRSPRRSDSPPSPPLPMLTLLTPPLTSSAHRDNRKTPKQLRTLSSPIYVPQELTSDQLRANIVQNLRLSINSSPQITVTPPPTAECDESRHFQLDLTNWTSNEIFERHLHERRRRRRLELRQNAVLGVPEQGHRAPTITKAADTLQPNGEPENGICSTRL